MVALRFFVIPSDDPQAPVANGRGEGFAMGAQHNFIDLILPAEIAKAIVKVNREPELREAGLDALWKLYYAPRHVLTRVELERDFGAFDNRFGLYCRRIAEELGATDVDALPLVNISHDAQGFEVLTLKPSVAEAIKCYAFSKLWR